MHTLGLRTGGQSFGSEATPRMCHVRIVRNAEVLDTPMDLVCDPCARPGSCHCSRSLHASPSRRGTSTERCERSCGHNLSSCYQRNSDTHTDTQTDNQTWWCASRSICDTQRKFRYHISEGKSGERCDTTSDDGLIQRGPWRCDDIMSEQVLAWPRLIQCRSNNMILSSPRLCPL